IDLDGLREVRDQLLAEALRAYRNGEPWWPSREFEAEHIVPEQAARREVDPWEPKVSDWVERESIRKCTVTEVLASGVGLEIAKCGTREQRRVTAILTGLKFKRARDESGRWWVRSGGLFDVG